MINVTKTYIPDREKLFRYFNEILDSGWLTNNGKLVQQLESRLREVLQVEYIILTVNGTCALQLAYKLAGLRGEVITTPFTFVATISSLIWEGLQPVFVDIDEETFNMDISKIEEKITGQTSAILPVHVFGNPCDVERLQNIAASHHLPVIYDAAHAFSVCKGSDHISSWGDMVVYSFHSTKIFHTIEGGALVVRSKKEYDQALLMRNFGIPGYDKIAELGVNYKMNEFQAAMGLAVLDEFHDVSLIRKGIYEYYFQAFSSNNNLKMQKVNPAWDCNYSYFPIVFRSESILSEVSKRLLENNIFARRYFYPSLNLLPYLKSAQTAPVAESVSKRILCLPLFPGLPRSTQNQIIDIVNEYA